MLRVTEVANRDSDLLENTVVVRGTLSYSARQWQLTEPNDTSGMFIALENSVNNDPKMNNVVHRLTRLSHQLLDNPMIWTNAQITGKLIRTGAGYLSLTDISQITADQKHVTITLPRTEDLPTASSTILQDISQDIEVNQSKTKLFSGYLLGKPANPQTVFFVVPNRLYRDIHQPERRFVAQITDIQACGLLMRLEEHDRISYQYTFECDLAVEGIIRKKPDKVQFPIEITTIKQMRLFGHNYVITWTSEAM